MRLLAAIIAALVFAPGGFARPVDAGCVTEGARAAATEARSSHVEWAKYIRSGRATPEEVRVAGGLAWHEGWVVKYDLILEAIDVSDFHCS